VNNKNVCRFLVGLFVKITMTVKLNEERESVIFSDLKEDIT
jgi:hypothetical protein